MTTVHNHQTKIKRAFRAAKIGAHPASAQAMLAAIPADALRALTGNQLAQMLDALWGACQQAKAIAAHEAVEGGAIWIGDRRYEVTG